MNAKISGLGAEPKKLAALGGLVLLAGYFYLSNRTPGDSSSAAPVSSRPALTATEGAVPLQRAAKPGRGRGAQRSSAQFEFHPTLKPKDGQVDKANVDPTLRLDLLERVQNVKIESVNRSLFESLASAPEAAVVASAEPKKIIPTFEYFGPAAPPKPEAAVAAAEPPAPPIPLKFYGFINPKSAGIKRAFFLDGDDIIVANEGQLIKSRYKIVRIGINSADVEDTQFKNHRQTLPLVEEQSS